MDYSVRNFSELSQNSLHADLAAHGGCYPLKKCLAMSLCVLGKAEE